MMQRLAMARRRKRPSKGETKKSPMVKSGVKEVVLTRELDDEDPEQENRIAQEPTSFIEITPSKPDEQVQELESLSSLIGIEEPIESSLSDQLAKAREENAQLKAILAHMTKEGLTITIPVPSLNPAGILDPAQYQQAKTLYAGIILEMINTTHKGMADKNGAVFNFYRINSESKEIQMTFSVVQPPS